MTRTSLRRVVSVEHRYLECSLSFDEVHRNIVASVPALKPEIWNMLVEGDREKVEAARKVWPKLWPFLIRNHGELTAVDGLKSKAMQYDIGNPLMAERMTRHELAAGLYAPLRVILYEDRRGRAIFEYHLPSTFFGQFEDERVTAVGRELDFELEMTLTAAAGA